MEMSKTTASIRGYTTCGSVRGQSGTLHRSREAAERDLARDQRICLRQGGYSDREVCVVARNWYLYRDESLQDWIPAEGGRGNGAMQFSRY